MFSKIYSATILGANAMKVRIEVDSTNGLPGETIVGLPDTVVRESRNRIRCAIRNSGYKYPLKSYTVNLAPAEVPKEGPLLDAAIALGILHNTNQLKIPENTLFVGELSLNGRLRPVRGIVSICEMAFQLGFDRVFVPSDNQTEASLIPDLDIVPVETLAELIAVITKAQPPKPIQVDAPPKIPQPHDFAQVKGQFFAKRAVEIAAAGGHNLLLVGPPGCGKTMLVRRLPTILPPLSSGQVVEVMKLNCLKVGMAPSVSIQTTPPFRAPHHSISYSGLAGGGRIPKPGEITLAHNGVLFLDELPEFSRQAIEALRQPLEEKKVVITRSNLTVEYPADFLFVGAMNPCPCGYYDDPTRDCVCTDHAIRRYRKKVSGPILDRIDLIIPMQRLAHRDLFEAQTPTDNPYTSLRIRQRVSAAREVQTTRFNRSVSNAQMSLEEFQRHCQIDANCQLLLKQFVDHGTLTGRSINKLIKVARTIADLAGHPTIQIDHVQEALHYRRIEIE